MTGSSQGDFISSVPESYRGKEWVQQNAKDADTFFKFVDNLNTVVGKKGVIVPGENASPEEVSGFFKGIGRPDNPDEYDFSNIEELKEVSRNTERDAVVKKLFHDAGVPKGMASKIQKGFEKVLYGEHTKIQAEQEKIGAEFDKSLKNIFGDRKDTVLSGVKKILTDNTPESVRAKVEELDNNSLIVLAAAVDGIAKKYIGEDPYTGGEGKTFSGAETYEQLSAKQRELMGQEGFTDFRHPNHQKLMDQNNGLLKKMREIKR